MAKKRRKYRIVRFRFAAGLLIVLGVTAAVLLGLFRIGTVEIVGVQQYPAQQVQEDLIYDFWSENTLYFGWKYRHAVSDPRVPYLESIQAKILSPGKVRIQVKEKKLVGYIQYAGINAYFDSTGMVLGMSDQGNDQLPLVSGVSMQEPVLYQKLPVENTAQLRTMLSISQLMVEAGLIPDNISFDENLNITLQIGSVEVKIGQDEYLEEKVANLVTIYQEVASQTGTLNMEAFTGKNETITFKKAEEQAAPQPETDENGNPVSTAETDENGNPVSTAETDENGNSISTAEPGADAEPEGADDTVSGETTGLSAFMAFDSSGTLRYDAHVVNGQVVDANGVVIDGCYVNEDGNVVDAYMNVIDPFTGQLAQ